MKPRFDRMEPPRTLSNYNTKCPGCGNNIEEGDNIFLIEEYWVCQTCKDEGMLPPDEAYQGVAE